MTDDDPSDALPPLKIAHLMAWTAATAVLMGVSRSWRGEAELLGSVATVAWAAAAAMVLLVVALGCLWRRRGLPFFDQPGHALALVAVFNVASTVCWVVLSSLVRLLDDGLRGTAEFDWVHVLAYVPISLLHVIAAGVAWRGMRRVADTRAWRWTLFFLAIKSLAYAAECVVFLVVFASPLGFYVYGVESVTAMVTSALNFFTAVTTCVAIAIDARRRTARHWSHWAAAVAHLVGSFSMLFWLLAVVVPAVVQWIAIAVGVATGGFATS